MTPRELCLEIGVEGGAVLIIPTGNGSRRYTRRITPTQARTYADIIARHAEAGRACNLRHWFNLDWSTDTDPEDSLEIARQLTLASFRASKYLMKAQLSKV